jgi:hypothetical protein
MSDASTGREEPADVRALLDRIDEAWRELLRLLDGIPDDLLIAPGAVGEWSLKDLYGHIAFWDEQAVHELDRALAGQPEDELDWQAMNDRDQLARQGRSLPEQRSAMHQAHATLVEQLEEVAGLDAAPIDRAIKGASYEHYEEHLPDLQSWRARHGL